MRRLLPAPQAPVDLCELYDMPATGLVRAGMVVSLDGTVAVEGRSGGLSGPADHEVFQVLRAAADVVLVGAGTARREDYGPVHLPHHLQTWRSAHGRERRPALAVVTRTFGIDVRSRLFCDPAQPLIVFGPARAVDGAAVPPHVELVAVGDDDVEPARVVDALRDRGLPRILCEGGPQLLTTLVQHGLVDELCLTLSPFLVGGGPALLSAQLHAPAAIRLLTLVEADGVLLTRWALR